MRAKYQIKRLLILGLPALALGFYLPLVIEDARIYRTVADKSHGCCGYVSENRLARPVTYFLVDEWTTPVWTENAIRNERWLTSDGLIDGEHKFWRILQREPIAATAP